MLGQRGGLRKLETSLGSASFALQLLCLRLAVIECHARGDVVPGALRLSLAEGAARLACEPGWVVEHARTVHLLRQEAQAWEKSAAFSAVELVDSVC